MFYSVFAKKIELNTCRTILGSAMQCIRFPCMALQEFADCPAQSGMLSLQETTDIFLNFTAKQKPEVDY